MYVLYVFRQREVLNDKDSVSKRLAGEEILIEKARAQLHDILQKAQVQTHTYTHTYIHTLMDPQPFKYTYIHNKHITVYRYILYIDT